MSGQKGAPLPCLADAEGELPGTMEVLLMGYDDAMQSVEAWAELGETNRMRQSQAHATAARNTILARLTAAESAREAAVAERDEAVERAETAEFLQRAAQSTRDDFEVDLAAALARAERAEKALLPFTALGLVGLWYEAPTSPAVDPMVLVRAPEVFDAARAALAHPATAEEN